MYTPHVESVNERFEQERYRLLSHLSYAVEKVGRSNIQEQLPLVLHSFVVGLNAEGAEIFDAQPELNRKTPPVELLKALRQEFSDSKGSFDRFVSGSEPKFVKLMQHVMQKMGYALVSQSEIPALQQSQKGMNPLPERFEFGKNITREQAFVITNDLDGCRKAFEQAEGLNEKVLPHWKMILGNSSRLKALEYYGLGLGLEMKRDGEMDWASAYMGSFPLPVKELATRRTQVCPDIRVTIPATASEKNEAKALRKGQESLRSSSMLSSRDRFNDSAHRFANSQLEESNEKIARLESDKCKYVPVDEYIKNHHKYFKPLEADERYFKTAMLVKRKMRFEKTPTESSPKDVLEMMDQVYGCGSELKVGRFISCHSDKHQGLYLSDAKVRIDEGVPVIDYNCQGLYTLEHNLKRNDFTLNEMGETGEVSFSTPEDAVNDLFLKRARSRTQEVREATLSSEHKLDVKRASAPR